MTGYKRYSLVFFTIICFTTFIYKGTVRAQNSNIDSTGFFHHTRIVSDFQWGRVLQSNDFVRGNNLVHQTIDDFHAFSVQMLKQTSGKKDWEKVYDYPSFGIGVYAVRFPNTPELGKPIAVYGLFTAPFKRWKNFDFDYLMGFGFTMNWESFEVAGNNYNIALGAEQSVYIDLGLELNYRMKNGISLGIGESFTHFSNGALKQPNYGINIAGTRLKLGYDFNSAPPPAVKPQVPLYKPGNEYLVSFFAGTKNVLYDGPGADSVTSFKGVYYPVYGISAGYNRQISYKSKLGAGICFDYFGAANSSITLLNGKLEDREASLHDGFEISIYPSYELVIDRLSLILQPGFYIHRRNYEGSTPWTYQRIGLKYHVLKNVFVGLNLHAYRYYISDYIEWNVGYRFR